MFVTIKFFNSKNLNDFTIEKFKTCRKYKC